MKIDADAAAPGRASVEVTGEVGLVKWPKTVPSLVTLTLKVQLACGASEAPLNVMRLPPATAIIVPPPQEPVTTLGVETSRPAGNRLL